MLESHTNFCPLFPLSTNVPPASPAMWDVASVAHEIVFVACSFTTHTSCPACVPTARIQPALLAPDGLTRATPTLAVATVPEAPGSGAVALCPVESEPLVTMLPLALLMLHCCVEKNASENPPMYPPVALQFPTKNFPELGLEHNLISGLVIQLPGIEST